MREVFRSMGAAGWAVVAILIALTILLGKCSWDANAARRAADKLAQDNARTAGADSSARDKASDERLADHIVITDREKERADAVSQIPDAPPSSRRLSRGCVQLRQQGTADADLPAACRPDGQAQAPARP